MTKRFVRRAGRTGSSLTMLVGLGLSTVSSSYAQIGPDPGTEPENGVVVPIPPTDPGPGPGTPAPNTRTPILPTTGTGFRITATGTLQETITDNAFDTVAQRKTDIVTTPELGLTLHDDGPHFTLDLSDLLSGDLYALNPSLDGFRQNFTGVSRSVLVPQLLSLDARVLIAPEIVGPGTVQSATERSLPSNGSTGYQDTYGYLIGPTLSNAFGTTALNSLSFTTGATVYSTPVGPTAAQTPSALSEIGVAQNSFVNTLTEKLSSGPHFTQFQWDGLLQDTETEQQTDNISDRVAQADLNYSLNRFVQLLSTFGYEQITDTQQLERGLSGPIATGGFRLTPGPRLDLSFQAGTRNREPTFSGNFRYDIGARSTLTGSYVDQITTQSQQQLGNLAQLGISPVTGTPINTQSGLNFQAQTPGELSLDNPLSRFREANVTLILHGLRTDYTATLFDSIQNTETKAAALILPRQTTFGGTFDITQRLTPQLTGDLNFSYSKATGDVEGGDENTLRGTASLGYQINPFLSAHLTYSHLSEDLGPVVTGSGGTIVENAIVLSVSRQF